MVVKCFGLSGYFKKKIKVLTTDLIDKKQMLVI